MSRFSLLKFFSDKGGEDHDGHLFWPGGPDGLPFRGDVVPDLRKGEMDELPIVASFRSRMFCLWEEDDKAEFDKIMEREAAGWYSIRKRYDHYEEAHKHYRVWLEWLQLYNEAPAGG
jgi:hypothetical protein